MSNIVPHTDILHLPRVPDFWMDIIKDQLPDLYPAPERIRGGGGGSSPDRPSPSNRFTLANPNKKLMKRWKDSGIKSVAALKAKWDETTHGPYTFPSLNGKELFMKAQLFGFCKHGCKNEDSHAPQPSDGIKAINDHLDKCGVPRD